MNPKWLVILGPLFTICGFCQGFGGLTTRPLSVCRERHVDAMRRWPELVAGSLKGDPKVVIRTFRSCFLVGDNAAEYADLLATAPAKEKRPRGGFMYSWPLDLGHGGQEGDVDVQVYVTEDPAFIEIVSVADVLH